MPHAMSLTLGIDPGLSGALALLDGDGAVLVADLPIIRDRSLAWVDGAQLRDTLQNAIGGRSCRAVVERVSAMPGQGISSAFVFSADLRLAKHDGRAEALLLAYWSRERRAAA